MAYFNESYLLLKDNYLFPEINKRVRAYLSCNPGTGSRLIKGGIGDVTHPLPQAVCQAMRQAVDEMAHEDSFHGYGPAQGYEFLREIIAKEAYRKRGISVEADEIFISDGSKCDCANILDIFGPENTVAVMNPAYPVYVDTCIMDGYHASSRAGHPGYPLVYLDCTEESGFVPTPPAIPPDLVYLCFPNNPTGSAITREDLRKWVSYALENNTTILYDGAYEAFIQDEDLPRSIYEIAGAENCAIEFRSFSKTAGFTGVRCGYTVVPKAIKLRSFSSGAWHHAHSLWNRRFTTKFNGVSYITQKAAAATFSSEGQDQIQRLIDGYMANAKYLQKIFADHGFSVFGGDHSPFLWIRTPRGMNSWNFFQRLLEDFQIIITPGSGFGEGGEGFFRVSAFIRNREIQEIHDRFTNNSPNY